jgi:hypothetical protein
MSLQSCRKCGYAVAIEGGACRHCAGASSAGAERMSWRDPKLLLPFGSVAIALAILLYHVLFR